MSKYLPEGWTQDRIDDALEFQRKSPNPTNPKQEGENMRKQAKDSLENATARPWKLDDLTVINRELLEALSEYIAEWEANHAHEDNKTGYTKEPNSLILAREAIARAEGTA